MDHTIRARIEGKQDPFIWKTITSKRRISQPDLQSLLESLIPIIDKYKEGTILKCPDWSEHDGYGDEGSPISMQDLADLFSSTKKMKKYLNSLSNYANVKQSIFPQDDPSSYLRYHVDRKADQGRQGEIIVCANKNCEPDFLGVFKSKLGENVEIVGSQEYFKGRLKKYS